MNVFVSYTRNKDAFNAVTEFCDHLANELSQSAPGSALFQDKLFVSPSDPFPEKIAQKLSEADILLILVSPAWLASSWCRKEYELFCADKAAQGQRPCLLPLLWVNTPALQKDAGDPIARELADIEHADFRDLRFESWDNPELRRQVAKLAEISVTKVPEQDRLRGQVP